MRSTLLALLAGLVAVTAPASALYLEGSGDEYQRHFVVLEITDANCPEGAAICFVDVNGDLAIIPALSTVNFTIHNRLTRAVTLDIRTLASPDMEDASRFASELLASISLAAGETKEVADVSMPDEVTHIRLEAVSGADRVEHDQELVNMRIYSSGPNSGDDPSVTGDKKRESPFLPALGFIGLLGVAAVLVAMTRKK